MQKIVSIIKYIYLYVANKYYSSILQSCTEKKTNNIILQSLPSLQDLYIEYRFL
jgi:hypothetical protein